jgi:peptide/nickel transport system substrate-binding protein
MDDKLIADRLAKAQVTRRGILGVGGILLLSSVAPGALRAAVAADEQVLKMINPTFDQNWSPLQGGGNNYPMFGFQYASPMYFDADMNLHPYVFTAWKGNADATVWTFDIDPKAVFSDNSPITAAEVKGSFELAAMPATKHQRIDQVLSGVNGYADVTSGKAKEMPGIVALDDHTLQITLTSADPVFFMRLASNLASIVKASAARDENGNEVTEWWHPDNNVAVSGPFKPTAMDLDAGTLTLEPNSNFFGPKPKLARIELQTIEDAVTATALLKKGEFNAATDLVTSTLIADLGAEFDSGPLIPRGHHFWLSVSQEPTNDPKVRQALIMSVDRKGLMNASFPNGPNKMAEQILDAVPGVDPNFVPYPYDPEGAKKALSESKYGGPERLPRLMMVGVSNPATEAAAQFIAEQWRQNLGIDRVDTKPEIDSYAGPDQGHIQIFRDDVGTRVPDAVVYLLGAIHSSSGNAQGKLGGYKNPEVDKLLDQAATLPVDDPQRIALAQKAQMLFRDDWTFIPWHHTIEPRLAMPQVKDAAKNLDWQYIDPWNITIAAS